MFGITTSGVRYYWSGVRCQLSVCLVVSFVVRKSQRTRPQRHRRPQGGQVSASGVARTVDGRSPSTVTPSKWTGFGRRCASCSGLRFPGAFGVDSQGVAVRRKASTICNEVRLLGEWTFTGESCQASVDQEGVVKRALGRLDRASSPRTSADRCMRFVRCSGCSSCSPGVAF